MPVLLQLCSLGQLSLGFGHKSGSDIWLSVQQHLQCGDVHILCCKQQRFTRGGQLRTLRSLHNAPVAPIQSGSCLAFTVCNLWLWARQGALCTGCTPVQSHALQLVSLSTDKSISRAQAVWSRLCCRLLLQGTCSSAC